MKHVEELVKAIENSNLQPLKCCECNKVLTIKDVCYKTGSVGITGVNLCIKHVVDT